MTGDDRVGAKSSPNIMGLTRTSSNTTVEGSSLDPGSFANTGGASTEGGLHEVSSHRVSSHLQL